MIYKDVRPAIFLDRPNRFIANVEIEGKSYISHVKNTGRCKEILIPGTKVFVKEVFDKKRKTKFDLISVFKGNKLINIDSQAPNKVFYEWIQKSNMFKKIDLIKPEKVYKNSRFDFYIEADGEKIYAEVKGVTLEKDGIALFPDAPTIRGVRHLNELCSSIQEGFSALAVFIIQMKGVKYFTPNAGMHKEFASALKYAQKCGVKLLALDCNVYENEISAADYVDVVV